MNETQYQRLKDVFEPLVGLDEEIIDVYLFRETPDCIHYLLFRLWAPFWTRQYYLALTEKRVIILPMPRSGYFEYRNHLSVKYEDISVNNNYNQININLTHPTRMLHLKFIFFEKQNNKEKFIKSLNDYKSNTAH